MTSSGSVDSVSFAPLTPGEELGQTKAVKSDSISEHYPQMSEIRKLIAGSALQPRRNFLARVFSFFVSILATITVIISGIFGLLFMIIIHPFVYFNRPLVMRWQSYTAGFIWTLLQLMLERFSGLQMTISGLEKIPTCENAFIISNHVCFADWAIVHAVAMRRGMLSFCKYFVKDSVKFLPIFGWGMKLMGMVMLKRDWARDRSKFQALFSLFTGGQLPVYLVSYPEGSRITSSKLIRSRAYAAENKLPILDNLLLPRSKGFIATMLGLRGSDVHVLYDFTVVYYQKGSGVGRTWPFLSMFTGRLDGYHVHIHVERIPFTQIPRGEDELKAWIFTQFKLKDGLVGAISQVYRDIFEVKQA